MARKASFEMRPEEASDTTEVLSLTRTPKPPVRAGQIAPAFRLRGLDGENIASIDLIARGPLVVSFYRGSWCDFCDTALERLSALAGDIQALGGEQVAIGPEPASEEQHRRLANLLMPVLIDPGLEVTRGYGLSTVVPRNERDRYVSLGYPAPADTAIKPWLITVPATYVIDPLGRIVMASIDTNYRNRLEGREILAVLRALQARIAI